MSEWVSVLAVFWILWALDGVRLGTRLGFTFVGRLAAPGRMPWRLGVLYQRWSLPGWWPWDWRMLAADVPLALSPEGIANLPAGAAGRPVEAPPASRGWRWRDVREVGVAKGWIFVNGTRFCPDTGHVSARELLALAQLAAPAREARIRTLISRWVRPAHLRRRGRVLLGRTRLPVMLNGVTWAGLVGLTIYVAGDLAARLPNRSSEALAASLPWFLLALLALHVTAVVATWRVVRRLKPVTAQKRGANLFSALLMPPQALRLRSLAAEGFFPPQHPLAAVLAFGGDRQRREWAFNVVADLRWPVAGGDEPPLAGEVTRWFRAALAPILLSRLRDAGLTAEELLVPPAPDAPASRTYCPRCGAQFVAGRAACPRGIRLQPLSPASAPPGPTAGS